ncbi:phosphate ABC transporter permease [Escherichia coli]|uniref:Phosphate ABC transporter permease n=1 Tax=Escherichia coli TaxID=562 RepID=A0A376MLS7_ECOLX|nr:phosphate ABC transporter permease [Escherichia coli]
MAMVEMQTTAALAESRRKMQARRRLKNRIALTLSMATMAFGLFLADLDFNVHHHPRYRWYVAGAVH